TGMTQGIMVVTAAALWWQPGLLTQLLMLAGAALICARSQRGAGSRPVSAELPSAASSQPHWPTLLLFGILFIALPLLGSPLGQLVADFYRAGSLVFGGGHVVLPLLQESVGHTLNEQQFLTGYSLAQLVPGPMFTLATYLGAQLQPEMPMIGALLASLALFAPGFLLLWAVGPCWQQWLARPRLAGAVTGINAAVVGLLLAALYQPVWQSAVLAPTDLALAAIGFYLLRVLKLPVPAIAALLVMATILLA
ncbi:MAG: chromate transporter, partial [Aeromonas veronii]